MLRIIPLLLPKNTTSTSTTDTKSNTPELIRVFPHSNISVRSRRVNPRDHPGFRMLLIKTVIDIMNENACKFFTYIQITTRLDHFNKDDLSEQVKRMLFDGVFSNNDATKLYDLRGTITLTGNNFTAAQLKNIEQTWKSYGPVGEMMRNDEKSISGSSKRLSLPDRFDTQELASKTTLEKLMQSIANPAPKLENEIYPDHLIPKLSPQMDGSDSGIHTGMSHQERHLLQLRTLHKICLEIVELRENTINESWFSIQMVQKAVANKNIKVFDYTTSSNESMMLKKINNKTCFSPSEQTRRTIISNCTRTLCRLNYIGTNEEGIQLSDLRYKLWMFNRNFNESIESLRTFDVENNRRSSCLPNSVTSKMTNQSMTLGGHHPSLMNCHSNVNSILTTSNTLNNFEVEETSSLNHLLDNTKNILSNFGESTRRRETIQQPEMQTESQMLTEEFSQRLVSAISSSLRGEIFTSRFFLYFF